MAQELLHTFTFSLLTESFLINMDPVINNVSRWLNENEKCFMPPICNKLMYGNGQLKVFFVGGPNTRKDFHIEEGEEYFYMLKGDMNLIVVERNEFKNIVIKEGEVFLLPGRIPHSPQRKENTTGIVVERERNPQEMDCLRYYVENSQEILYEKWFHCRSLDTQLPPIIMEFFSSEQCRTGKPIADTLLIDKPIQQDCLTELQKPFSLREWIQLHRDEIDSGKKNLFPGNYTSRINILGAGDHRSEHDLPEIFLWQLEGCSCISIGSKKYKLFQDYTVLLASNEEWNMENEGITLSVIMNTVKNRL